MEQDQQQVEQGSASAVQQHVEQGLPNWPCVLRVKTCPSTNSLLASLALQDQVQAPTVLVANDQTAGRGRSGRRWSTAPGTSLTFSMLLEPAVPAQHVSQITLVTGLAVVEVLRRYGFEAAVKWPNDVVLAHPHSLEGFGRWRKVCGILAQGLPGQEGAVVVGVGINVSQRLDQIPVAWATSLGVVAHDAQTNAGSHVQGSQVELPTRDELLPHILQEMSRAISRFEQSGFASMVSQYVSCSATIGHKVRVQMIGGDIVGMATGVRDDGALVLETSDGSVHCVTEGDVIHLRRD